MSIVQGDDPLNCEYDPIGIGSWVDAKSLDEFSDADIVVKAKVVGHRDFTDAYLTVPDARPGKQSYLMNDLEFLEVLKGSLDATKVSATSGGGVCLATGGVYYLFLTSPLETEPISSEPFVDDPNSRQYPDAYYIRHPFAQFPVKKGRIEISELLREESLPSQYHGLSEAAFKEELMRVLSRKP